MERRSPYHVKLSGETNRKVKRNMVKRWQNRLIKQRPGDILDSHVPPRAESIRPAGRAPGGARRPRAGRPTGRAEGLRIFRRDDAPRAYPVEAPVDQGVDGARQKRRR